MNQPHALSLAAVAPQPVALEKHYSVQEVAEMWGLSEHSIRRMFEDVPGVLKLCHPGLLRRSKQKPKTTLRIPASLVQLTHEQRSGNLRSKVQGGRRGV